MKKNVVRYITEYCNGRINVYYRISEPDIPGSCGITSYGEYDDSPSTPGKVIDETLIYSTNVSFIQKDYSNIFKLRPKSDDESLGKKADEEMFEIGMEIMFKGYPEYLNELSNTSFMGIYRPYYDRGKYYSTNKFSNLVFTQFKLNRLLELKKNSRNDYLVEYIESDWNEMITSSLSFSKQFIERYINDNYILPLGYKFVVYTNDINISSINNSGVYECFDTLKLEVHPPTGYINDEKIIIYTLDIDLEKLHLGRRDAKINFDAIDNALSNNIKYIINRCEEYDKIYQNRNIKQDRYFINFGQENKIISKYEIEKIKKYYRCIDNLIKKHGCIEITYEFYTKLSKIKYNYSGIVRDINTIQVFIFIKGPLIDYYKPVLTIHEYGFEEMGLDEFENDFETEILPKLIKYFELKGLDVSFNKVDKKLHSFLCNLRDNTIKLKSHNEIEEALKIRLDVYEKICKREEKKCIEMEIIKKHEEKLKEEKLKQIELRNKESKKLKDIIKRIFNL